MGWEFGTLSWMGILYWITGMDELGLLAFPAWIGLSAALGLYHALFGLCVVTAFRIPHSTFRIVVLVPACWVAVEFLRAHAFTGFPWALLGSSQMLNLPLVQWASVFGVYGLSYVVVLGNAALIKRGLTPFLVIVVAHGIGWWMWKRVSVENWQHPFRVAVLQGNIAQPDKWSREFQDWTFSFYGRLINEADHFDFVVWPETAVPNFIRYEREPRERLQKIVRQSRAWHLVGAPDADLNERGEMTRQANSVFLVSAEGSLTARYDKRHLVPFGEFTPFEWLKPLVTKYTIGVAEFRRGEGNGVLSSPFGTLAPLICYEAIFPHEVSRAVRKGAEVLVNVSNDAWFGQSAAPYQHAQAAVFRAVETRRYLIRAANGGVSGVIEPSGQVWPAGSLTESKVLTAAIEPKTGLTWYVRFGDWFAWLCVTFASLGFLGPLFHNRYGIKRRGDVGRR